MPHAGILPAEAAVAFTALPPHQPLEPVMQITAQKKNRSFNPVSWIVIGALAGAGVTVSLQSIARGNSGPLPLQEMRQLAGVFGMIKNDYVEEVDEKKLITDAIAGMVESLDPHSQYYTPEEYEEFKEGTSGEFVGIGIEITQEDGLIKIVSPIEDTPGFRAGLQSNDLITRVDGQSVKKMSLTKAVKKMRGKPDTKVVLTIYRKSEERTFPVTIVRDKIKVQSVKAKLLEKDYMWVRLTQFQERTVRDFADKVTKLHRQNPQAKGMVLDLRNDPGGLLDAAIGIASAFLPDNVTVVSTDGQLKSSKGVYTTSTRFIRPDNVEALKEMERETGGRLKDIPLVVLVNAGSASASEIVAGAMQDHRRAKVMGIRTFGKGSVQTVRPLGGGAGIKLTTARYFTPSGKSIQAKGVTPDILIDETAEGNLYAALSMREADLEQHITGADEDSLDAQRREKARLEALRKLDEDKKAGKKPTRLPRFGEPDDFQLQQALNQLKGKPVKVSTTQRKDAKDKTEEDDDS